MLKKRGFTLIELMIVVAIIGILAAIAIPKFADLVRKSNEASTKGNLGAIRSALSIYYGDQEGMYPNDLTSGLTTSSKYLASLPNAIVPNANLNTNTVTAGNLNGAANVNTTVANCTTGGWAYDNLSTRPSYGTVLVNCNSTDSKGNYWTTY